MFNKKIGLLALACAAMGLAGCNKGGETPDSSKPQGGGDTGTSQASNTQQGGGGDTEEAIPQEAGKIGIYFELADSENAKLAEMPDYCSPFICGAFNSWGETIEKGVFEMSRKAETNIFYCYVDDTVSFADLSYQIVLGYNAASGLGTADHGITNWDLKTMYCASFPYGSNPQMVAVNDHLYSCPSADAEHPMAFSTWLDEPVKVKNISLSFTLDESVQLQSNHEIAMKGGYDGWTSKKAVPCVDGVYTLLIAGEEGIIAGDISLCVSIRNKVTMKDDINDKYNLALVPMSGSASGGEEELDEKDNVYRLSNILIGIQAARGHGYTYNLGKLKCPEHANGTADAYAYPANELPALEKDLKINLTHTGAAALENASVCIAGTVCGWDAPHAAMTVVETGKSWSFTVAKEGLFLSNTVMFKFTDGGWNSWELAVADDVKTNADGNFEFVIEANKYNINISADMTGWGNAEAESKKVTTSAVAYVGDKMDVDVTIKVTHVGETALADDAVVTIAGSMNGWDHKPMTKGESGEYTYVVSKADYYDGDMIKFDITANGWNGKVNGPDGDIAVTLKCGYDLVEITADLSELATANKQYVSLNYSASVAIA